MNSKQLISLGIAGGLLILSVLFGYASDAAELAYLAETGKSYGSSTLEMITFFAAVASLVGAIFISVQVFLGWWDSHG